MHVQEGIPFEYSDERFAIIVSRYNDSITGKLLAGAHETLLSAGVPEDEIDVVWVPGAWEIPLAAQALAQQERYAGVICLGAVIRGETSHDEHINRMVSLELGGVSREFSLPVGFGVLTCHSLEQAIHRAGGNVGNKGIEATSAVLEMAALLKRLAA